MSEKPEAAREVHDEHIEQSRHNLQDAHVAIHTDTYDISEDALGINLPKHYYFSPGFIGTVTVRLSPFRSFSFSNTTQALCLGNISNYLGWVMPSNCLALINESIGPSDNITWVALAYSLGLSIGFSRRRPPFRHLRPPLVFHRWQRPSSHRHNRLWNRYPCREYHRG
jgi:hypothetical protein